MRLQALGFLASIALAACSDPAQSSVRITYLADPSAPPVKGLRIFWGMDKSRSFDVAPGKDAVLSMYPRGNGELMIDFELDGQNKHWSDNIGPSAAHEVLSMQVWLNNHGDVLEKHCRAPCEYTLPWYEPWWSSLKE